MIPLFLVTLFAFVGCAAIALLLDNSAYGTPVSGNSEAIDPLYNPTGSAFDLQRQLERAIDTCSSQRVGRYQHAENAIWGVVPLSKQHSGLERKLI